MNYALLANSLVVIVLWGIWVHGNKEGVDRMGDRWAEAFWASLWSGVLYLGVAVACILWKGLPGTAVGTGYLLLGAVGAVAGYLVFLWGLSRFPETVYASITALYPAVAVLLAVALRGEHPSPSQWAGIALALGAVFLLSR